MASSTFLLGVVCIFTINHAVLSHHINGTDIGHHHPEGGSHSHPDVNTRSNYDSNHQSEGANYPEKFNYFDLDLLQSVCESKEGNVLISPASVKTLLGLLLEGAGGESAKQIRHALRLDNEQLATAQLHKFQLSLQPDGLQNSTKLSVANGAFLTDKATLKQQYKQILQSNYKADVEKVNMANPQETAKTINSWISNKTDGLIPNLIEEGSIDPSALLVLTNAIYFNALWEIAFEPRMVSLGTCFRTSPDVCSPIRTMEVVGEFRYAERDFGQVLEMEYKDKRYSMVIILPRKSDGVNLLIRDLAHLRINSLLSEVTKTEVKVTLPRFTLEFDADLVENLKALDIKDVFEQTSSLPGMVEGKSPSVSKVFHKAKIQVTEEGAAAGAASGALVVPLMGSSMPHFAATHPFLFYIRDVQTNGLLFAGRLSVPQDADNTAYPHPPSYMPSSHPPPKYPHSTHLTSNSPTPSTTDESTDTALGKGNQKKQRASGPRNTGSYLS